MVRVDYSRYSILYSWEELPSPPYGIFGDGPGLAINELEE